ncbi:MAG TPA: peptide ABC transporter substrate-binding protein [Candidatus Baltobacteraceae bacterium]|jgi:peptide/nickel transport system substrate-binding protein
MKRLSILAAFVALLGAYQPHVLTYADGGDISSLNPFLATEGNAPLYSELTMAQFVRFDAHGNPIPELITEIPTRTNGGISNDGKTITYHLRPNVKWSDGHPFDADDVIFTVAVAKDDRNNLYIRDPWDRITSVSAPNKYTVLFHLEEPYATFIEDYFSTQSSSCILPRHIIGPGTQINQAPYNSLPVGIGPFRYAAYKRGDSVVMEANPYYWRGRPKLQRVVYKIITDQNTLMTQLQTGEISLWPAINGPLLDRAKALPGKRSTTWLTNFVGGIFFNVAKPQLSDPHVRRALRLATDRATLFDKVVHRNGVLTQSLVPRTSVDYLDISVTKLDPDAAARMLDAAGWKLGGDGLRHKNGVALTIDLAIPSGYQPSEILASILKEDWAKIGVGVTIHMWSTPQFFAPYTSGGIIQRGRFDAALYSNASGPIFASINGYFDCASIPPRGGNSDRYCNHQVDALDNRYLHSYDPRVRRQAAAAMQRLLDQDAPAITIYERKYVSVFDNRLTGYYPSSFSFWGDPLELDI